MTNHTAIPLWPGRAPGAIGDGIVDRPQLTAHLPPSGSACGTGVIVCPGGGYRTLAADHEGLQVAQWLNRRGIAAFVLRYRLGERYHSDVSLLDGLRAVRLVRHRAAEFGIAEQRIGLLGFSAGGHVTVAVGTGWDAGDPNAGDAIEQASSRPDFLVPVYAVTNGVVRGRKADEYTPTDVRVNARTPPTFLVHSHEDTIVPGNQSTLFYDALLKAGVPAELHIYGFGEHGMGLGSGDPDFRGWPDLLMNWLRRHGLLTAAERCRVVGRVTRNGKAFGAAWVTFTPLEDTTPAAAARASRGEDGAFNIPASHGVVPGPHRVEVRHISEQHPPAKTGAYTLDGAKRYDLGVMQIGEAPLELNIEE